MDYILCTVSTILYGDLSLGVQMSGMCGSGSCYGKSIKSIKSINLVATLIY